MARHIVIIDYRRLNNVVPYWRRLIENLGRRSKIGLSYWGLIHVSAKPVLHRIVLYRFREVKDGPRSLRDRVIHFPPSGSFKKVYGNRYLIKKWT
ncbi:MAG: hypothetical protein QXO32_03015 [Candidatus Bathyarchaeia archaeon]